MKNIKKFEHFNLPEETNVYSENHESQNYMFFANLQNIQRYIDAIKELPQEEVDEMLSEHDWASDHVSVACENLEHVHNFLVNSFSDHISLPKTENNDEDDEDNESHLYGEGDKYDSYDEEDEEDEEDDTM